MTRMYRPPEPIEIEVDELDNPLVFTWRGRRHPIEHLAQRWRVNTEWWSIEGRVWQEYFKLATTTGMLVIIIQNLLTREWFILRVYD